MCNGCPHCQAGYCGCYDLILEQKNGVYEPLYECVNPDENRE